MMLAPDNRRMAAAFMPGQREEPGGEHLFLAQPSGEAGGGDRGVGERAPGQVTGTQHERDEVVKPLAVCREQRHRGDTVVPVGAQGRGEFPVRALHRGISKLRWPGPAHIPRTS